MAAQKSGAKCPLDVGTGVLDGPNSNSIAHL